MGKLIAVCTSPEKGTQKQEVREARLKENWGLEGDAHAGAWHRQVSLLALEQIEAFRAKGAQVQFGAFGENFVVSGYDLKILPIGTRFACGDCILELTQIGKHCHHGCEIFHLMGDCIMPREGVFCRVLRGGVVRAGDTFSLLECSSL
ncbi:MAG: MOSC domain-containing protein [Oscillospiraceae bacterium]|jgi:TatD DNase family protein|nr:MOSC domain-containing protein [Oscillospiraceae bacterium]